LQASANEGGNGGSSTGVMAGVQVESLTSSLSHQLGISPDTQGVVVTQVNPDSAAAQAGLARGDVIEEVNRHSVHTTEQYSQEMSRANKDSVLLLVNRGGTTSYLVVQAQQ
ncbi:MAG: PDZ domain-containing protein, partial [Bryobacteraceae bacterium]